MLVISDINNEYNSSIALIVLCCRIHFKSSNLDDLRAFVNTNKVDWSVFYKSNLTQKVRPLVYRILLKIELPVSVKIKLTSELNKLTLQSFEQAKETERIIFLFKEHNIKLIPYKGTAFSKQFFGNIGMRESSDIDLIIAPQNIPKAIVLLENDGYSPYRKEYYDWVGRDNFVQFHKDFSFDKHEGTKRLHHVELHFNIISKTTYLPDNRNTFATQQTTNYQLFQKQVNCLLPVEHFRAVTLHHMLMDTMGYMKTVVDLAQMWLTIEEAQSKNELSTAEIKLFHKMEEHYNLPLVQYTLRELLGVETVLQTKVNTSKNIINRVLSGSYRKVRKNDSPLLDTISFSYTHLKYSSYFYLKRSDRMKYILKSIISFTQPQPEDCLAITLPKPLYFLYYIIRPFRLLFFQGDPTKK